MNVAEALKSRRSTRRYKQDPVPTEALMEIADICRFAPSAGNRQEWELVLVDDVQVCEGVFDTLAWLPDVGPPPAGKMPPAYIVIISDEKSDALADCACVATYIQLAACEKGLGSCWFGSISRTELSELLKVPDKYSIEFVVSLGYADENRKVVDSSENREVSVSGGVTTVPKRPKDDLVHLNCYGNGAKR